MDVGETPPSFECAGRLGLPVMFAITGGWPAQFKPLFDYLKQVYQTDGHNMKWFETEMQMFSLFCEKNKNY